ncbi:MAG TPA: hypothetical protein DIC36_04955 [Gammaproteobacteria bacterium]|nr:hypothetical protein [Gammaproteobacteria bacterium]
MMLKNSTLAVVAMMLGFALQNANADKITTIQEKDGSTTVVKTDVRGTQVENGGKTVYLSGEDRHKEQVDHSVKGGGKVVTEKSR